MASILAVEGHTQGIVISEFVGREREGGADETPQNIRR